MSTIDPVSDLLLRWEDAQRGGAAVPPEELCRDCPEHLADLRERIAALAAMDSLLDAGPSATPGPPTLTPPQRPVS